MPVIISWEDVSALTEPQLSQVCFILISSKIILFLEIPRSLTKSIRNHLSEITGAENLINI